MTSPRFEKDRDAASYDAFTADYERYMARLAQPLAEHICALAQVQAGERVLDIGCGSGLATRAAAQRIGPDGYALGVDLSAGMVALAHSIRRSPALEYARMDAEALELPAAAFDKVVSLNAVLHFPDIDRAMREMFRVLKPGGRVAVSFGSGRPLTGWGVVPYAGQRAWRVLTSLWRPYMRAPHDLSRLVRAEVPEVDDAILTSWSTHRAPVRLQAAMRAAGFETLHSGWQGRDIRFTSAQEFWDAQAAIVTVVRKRLATAPPAIVAAIQRRFIAQAEHVLQRRGELLYHYGAFFVWGRKP